MRVIVVCHIFEKWVYGSQNYLTLWKNAVFVREVLTEKYMAEDVLGEW